MNAKLTLWLMTMGLALTAHGQERVDVRDLPAEVQQTIESRRDDGMVKQVTRRSLDGRTVYDVEIEKNNALNPRLRIAEDGTVLRGAAAGAGSTIDGAPLVTDEFGGVIVPMEPRLKLPDLPDAVRQTARAEAKGREIVDIDRETWKGQAVYEIEFKERGLNSRVYISDDGKVVRDVQRQVHTLRSLFLGTQLLDTPAAVQETVQRIANDRDVVDIDRKGVGDQTVYRIEIREGSNRHELRIAADGKVIYDSRAATQRRG